MTSRNTVQKNVIYNALCRLKNHPTADELYENIHTEFPSISKTTVYRVLGQLAESGVVLRVKINEGADHFDHQTHPHFHIRCTKCGRVDDVETENIGELQSKVTDSCGFLITGVSVQFEGVCSKCLNNTNDN